MPSLLSRTTKVPLYFLFHHSKLITYRTFMKHQCFTFLFVYLLGCIGSQLWHMGSSLCHADLLLQCSDSLVVVLGLSSCSMQAQLLEGMWDLSSLTRNQTPIPCIASGFLTSDLQGSSSFIFLILYLYLIILDLIILKIGHINISPTYDRELRQREIHMSFPSMCFS